LSAEYPQHPIAAVGAVLVKNGAVLLVKRGYPPGKGMWAVPGGVIEVGESIEDAAVRELEEETGLRAEPRGIVWVTNVVVREGARVRYHYVIIDVLFDSRTVKGFLRPGGDAVDVAWMSMDEVVARSDVSRTTKSLVEYLRRNPCPPLLPLAKI